MSVFVDDLQGHTVEMGADEEFETASTIKAYILAVLYLQASRGKASLTEEIEYQPEHFVDGSGMLRALGVGARLKVKDTATMMIICSDNIATNMVIDYLGLEKMCIRDSTRRGAAPGVCRAGTGTDPALRGTALAAAPYFGWRAAVPRQEHPGLAERCGTGPGGELRQSADLSAPERGLCPGGTAAIGRAAPPAERAGKSGAKPPEAARLRHSGQEPGGRRHGPEPVSYTHLEGKTGDWGEVVTR